MNMLYALEVLLFIPIHMVAWAQPNVMQGAGSDLLMKVEICDVAPHGAIIPIKSNQYKFLNSYGLYLDY